MPRLLAGPRGLREDTRHEARHAQLVLLHLLSHTDASAGRSRIRYVKGQDDGIDAIAGLSSNAVWWSARHLPPCSRASVHQVPLIL
jgi:hypothetical protein